MKFNKQQYSNGLVSLNAETLIYFYFILFKLFYMLINIKYTNLNINKNF